MLKFYFDRTEFSVYVRIWRKQNKLTLQEVSELTGIAPNTINNIERNENAPSLETVMVICSVMDADPRQFIKNSGKGA